MTDSNTPEGRLDTAVLDTLAHRAQTHPLVTGWEYLPSHRAPRKLQIILDETAYPTTGVVARLDIRWFDTDDYSVQYLESEEAGVRYTVGRKSFTESPLEQ